MANYRPLSAIYGMSPIIEKLFKTVLHIKDASWQRVIDQVQDWKDQSNRETFDHCEQQPDIAMLSLAYRALEEMAISRTIDLEDIM